MLTHNILLVIFGLLSVHSDSVSEKYDANYRSQNLIPIVVKLNYSESYTYNVNNTESYLFLYDYMKVNYILAKVYLFLIII